MFKIRQFHNLEISNALVRYSQFNIREFTSVSFVSRAREGGQNEESSDDDRTLRSIAMSKFFSGKGQTSDKNQTHKATKSE